MTNQRAVPSSHAERQTPGILLIEGCENIAERSQLPSRVITISHFG